jgi:hypothetical protein
MLYSFDNKRLSNRFRKIFDKVTVRTRQLRVSDKDIILDFNIEVLLFEEGEL